MIRRAGCAGGSWPPGCRGAEARGDEEVKLACAGFPPALGSRFRRNDGPRAGWGVPSCRPARPHASGVGATTAQTGNRPPLAMLGSPRSRASPPYRRTLPRHSTRGCSTARHTRAWQILGKRCANGGILDRVGHVGGDIRRCCGARIARGGSPSAESPLPIAVEAARKEAALAEHSSLPQVKLGPLVVWDDPDGVGAGSGRAQGWRIVQERPLKLEGVSGGPTLFADD